MERIGLIAGGGRLPVIFAEEAKRKGEKVIGFAIKGMALPKLDNACDKVHWLDVGQFKKFFFLLLTERVRKIALLGKFDKSVMYSNVAKDENALKFLKESKDKTDYGLLDKITSELKKVGVEVIDGIEYLFPLLPSKGVLTRRHPTEKENEDIRFGFGIAKEIARMDIGQSVIVKDKTVVSVEAMEGTNRAIERAPALCGEGFVVVKVSRPQQDMRWDIPVIGPETVELIAQKKGKALAIEAKKMFLVKKETCINLADANNISIVAI